MSTPRKPAAIRCAIYTRKSSSEGLDGEYTSLDNQRDYCANYIASQRGEGWTELPTRYDDGGFSGGNLNRPAMKQLRSDIAAGLIDVVVVYKIDRLSRSLRDFANLVAEFEQRNVTFVSVTQSFNTATSMGRLTLNVLLSFAQFERELTGERLREWFANARAKGLWPAQRPFGYRVVESCLVVDEAEAKTVRMVFDLYAKSGSAATTAAELTRRGFMAKDDRPFTCSSVARLLNNRLYRGFHPNKAAHERKTHPAIISEKVWQATQSAKSTRGRGRSNPRPKGDRRSRSSARSTDEPMLKGIIFGRSGNAMLHLPARGRNGRVYRYYVDAAAGRYGAGAPPARRFRAEDVEAAILALIAHMHGVDDIPHGNAGALVRQFVRRVDVRENEFCVLLTSGIARSTPLVGQIAETRRTKRAPH